MSRHRLHPECTECEGEMFFSCVIERGRLVEVARESPAHDSEPTIWQIAAEVSDHSRNDESLAA